MSSSVPRRSRGRTIAVGLIILVLLLIAGAGMLVWRKGVNAGESVARAPLMPTSAPSQPGTTTPPRVAPPRPAAAGSALNVLVVRKGAEGGKGVEGIALVHIDDPRTRVDVVGLPPGLQLGRPGTTPTTLGDTYRSGGAPALVEAVEDLVQVPVDHAAELNPEGYAAMQGLLTSGANPLTAMDKVDTVLANMSVDEGLTNDLMQDLMVKLATSGKPHVHSFSATGDVVKSPETARLRTALQTDSLATY